MSFFNTLELAPKDPILGLNELFNADTRDHKVNLGVGVYYDDNGKLTLLKAVQQAELERVQKNLARGYLPIDGVATYNSGVQKLLFGQNENMLSRSTTVQTFGGTGALKIGADFLKHFGAEGAKVAISDPSWENHRAIFEMAGFDVITYAYYNNQTRLADVTAMVQSLEKMPANTIIILHACCHNPTGADLSREDWQKVVAVCQKNQLIPFLDMAYQGFSQGIKEDAVAIDLFSQSGLPVFVSSSFSKSFALYGERVGALTIITDNADEKTKVLSQVKRVIRTNYSNPATHGASLVSSILNTESLYTMWEQELATMRVRIKAMRQQFVQDLASTADFSFVNKQQGMFSYSGLTAEQVERLKQEFAIYAVSSGRICVAALNSQNIAYVINAIKTVI
jgi:aromatic-amino-acid transaminase